MGAAAAALGELFGDEAVKHGFQGPGRIREHRLLLGGDQPESVDVPLRSLGHPLQELAVLSQKDLHAALGKEVRVVDQVEMEAVLQVFHVDRQIEFGRRLRLAEQLHLEAFYPGRLEGEIEQVEEHLKEGRAGKVARYLELLHQLLVGHLLVGEGS